MKNKFLLISIIILILIVIPVIVSAEPPKIKLVVDPVTGDAPLTINVDETSGDATIIRWEYDFGDGGILKEKKGEHVYETEGEYTLTLTVFNEKEEKSTESVIITVTSPPITIKPVADFTAEPLSGMAPLVVYFTDLSTGSPKEWIWNFGDGSSTSTDKNPKHQYLKPNTYTVSLTAKNGAGEDTETKSGYITVTVKQDVGTVTLTEGITETTATKIDLTSTTGSIKVSDKLNGFEVISTTKIDDATFIPTTTTIDKTVIWTTGGTTPDASFEYRYLGNSLKESVTLNKDMDLKFPVKLSKDTKLIPWYNGQWKLVSSTSGNTMDGIILEKPYGIDTNGNYVEMNYKYDGSELHLVYNRTLTVIYINESGKDPVEEIQYLPIKYPLVIDPTWTSYQSHWISPDGDYTLEMWNASGVGTFNATTLSNTSNVTYWIVGGGGGGGKALGGGGGGAGGYWTGNITNLSGVINISVGAGGAAATVANTSGISGQPTIFWNGTASNITAIGGGGGGSRAIGPALQGGSGGGGGSPASAGSNPGNTSNESAGHGNSGGYGPYNTSTTYSGGGGGGMISEGVNGAASKGGNGGGAINITLNLTNITLAGGGGGGVYSNTQANRGAGGSNGTVVGGNGAYRTTAATAAVAATGSGGGGGGSTGAGSAGSTGVIYIRYLSPPNTNFTSNITAGYGPLSVQFNDTSLNSPTSWSWAYSNETTGWTQFSTDQNPVYTFPKGVYNINLTTTNEGGTTSLSKQWSVCVERCIMNPWYDASIINGNYYANNLSQARDAPTGTSVSTSTAVIRWSTDSSGYEGNLYRVGQTYNLTGIPAEANITYGKLSLFGNDKYTDWGTDPSIRIVTFNPINKSSFATSDYNVSLWGNASLGSIAYSSFSGTNWNNITITSPNTTLSAGNLSTIGLRGTDDITGADHSLLANMYFRMGFNGKSVATNKPMLTINFSAPASPSPIANFTSNVTSGTAPTSVQFNDTSTNTPTSWNWSYANMTGNSTEIWWSTTQNATVVFGIGNWSIHLNATNAGGSNISTQVTFINVTAAGVAPVANFTQNVTTGTVPTSVQFNDTSTNTPTDWKWFFGDESYNESWFNETSVGGYPGWKGRMSHTAVVLPDASIVIAGGDSAGAPDFNDTWRSNNSGLTWVQQTASAEWQSRYEHMSVALSDGSILLMGGTNRANSTLYNDTWRSTDKGVTWTLQNGSSGWTGRYNAGIAVLPDDNIVIMGGYTSYKNDTWRSTDKGVTWTQQSTAPGWSARRNLRSVSLPDGSIVMTGGRNAGGNLNDTWRSTDKGVTWVQQNASSGWVARYAHSMVTMPDGSIIIAGGSSGAQRNDVWRSTDKGVTWTQLDAAAEWAARYGSPMVEAGAGTALIIGGGSALYNDTWQISINSDLNSFVQNPVHTYTAAGNYSITLTALNAYGYNTTTAWTHYVNVTAAGVAPVANFTQNVTSGTVSTSVQFNDTSTNTPTGWAWFFGDEPYTQTWINKTSTPTPGWAGRLLHGTVILPDNSIVIMGGTDDSITPTRFNDTWRSTDGGTTWVEQNASGGWKKRASLVSVAQPDGSIVLMAGEDGVTALTDVWRSTDKGVSWTQVNSSWGANRWGHAAVVMPDGSIIVMGGGGDDYKNDTIRSTNNGTTWTQMNASGGWQARRKLDGSGVVLPDKSIVLIGGYGSGTNYQDVWRSTNNGTTWVQQNASVPWGDRYNSMALSLFDGSIVAIGGGDNQTWRSTDKGVSWLQLADGGSFTAGHGFKAVQINNGSIVFVGGMMGSSARNHTWAKQPVGSNLQNPEHTYTAAGNYSITLTASNAYGFNTTTAWTHWVNVTAAGAAPIVQWVLDHTLVRIPQAVIVNDTSLNTPTSWNWSWGDGTANGTTNNATHEYTKRGKWNITLTATNAVGSNTSAAVAVRVVGYETYW